jgi:hypothetical protein
MISDEVLDIYTHGRYTKRKKKTYITPPTINYLEKIAQNNLVYY